MLTRALLALFLALCPLSAVAEIVVFNHGGFLEVKGYKVEGDRILLELTNGGVLDMSVYQIESILKDEVETPEPVPPAPRFTLRFAEHHATPQTPYGELIYAAGRRYSLNPALVAAVARTESAFNPQAVSAKGARGIMQLMPATARQFGIEGEEAFDPAKNIDAGARYLDYLARRFDSRLPLILAAYNSGIGTVERYGDIPPYQETHDYLRRVYSVLGLDERELAAGSDGR